MSGRKADDRVPFHWQGTWEEFDAEVRRRWIGASERYGLDSGLPASAVAACHAAEAGLPADAAALIAQAVPAVGELFKVVESHERVMYAALIELSCGNPKGAERMLEEQLDGFDGPEWNGTESGSEWLERTREAKQ